MVNDGSLECSSNDADCRGKLSICWVRSEWEGWLGLLGHHSKVTETYNLTEPEWHRRLVEFFAGGGGAGGRGGFQWYSVALHDFGDSLPCYPLFCLSWLHITASILASSHWQSASLLLHVSPTGQFHFTYEQSLSQVQSLSHARSL